MSRQKSGALLVSDLDAQAGDVVDVAVTAGQLTAACSGVFGPAIAWMLLLAAMSSSNAGWFGQPLGGLIGASGLFMALLIGARSGRRSAVVLAEQLRVRRLSSDPLTMPRVQTQSRVSHQMPDMGQFRK